MLEIDIVKASSNQAKPSSFYMSDDADISEVDTALNTPIGSLMDTSIKRFSTTSSTSSFNTIKSCRKPSITPKSNDDLIPLLEKRLYLMEQELNEHIKRELDLEAQLMQQKKDSSYKTTLNRMSKRIDSFFQTQHQCGSANNNKSINFNNTSECYDWLVGNELPSLYIKQKEHFMQAPCNTIADGETNNIGCDNMLSFNKILIYRLQSIMKKSGHHDELYDQLYITLTAWEQHEDQRQLEVYEQRERDNNKISRLLDALNKSLLKNKILRRDSNLIIKKHQSDLKSITKEKSFYKQQIERKMHQQEKRQDVKMCHEQVPNHQVCEEKLLNLKTVLESQIENLDKMLLNCQEERDEYEATVEMVRREMESMLEELEDTRQQKLRFKTQASRLRSGLEAIQKKKKTTCRDTKNTNESSSEDEEEDETTEAIRLMYNEAERQAMDLDRECKRQALSLSSVRKELKSAEEKYHSIKTQKNIQMHQLEQANRELNRKVDILQAEKQNLSVCLKESQQKLDTKPDNISMVTTEGEGQEQQCMDQAKIYALQIALKAAKSDASIQRTKIFQLERQASLLDFSQSIVELQETFQNQLSSVFQSSNDIVNKAVAEKVEYEQSLWKSRCEKSIQKKYDTSLLQVNRELRFSSGRIVELEDELETLSLNHKEEMKRVKYRIEGESNKKLQKTISYHKTREQELQSKLDVIYQTNQTLQDELLVLCGRNLMMANQLGNI